MHFGFHLCGFARRYLLHISISKSNEDEKSVKIVSYKILQGIARVSHFVINFKQFTLI